MPSKDLHVPGSAAALRWLENADGVRHIVTGSAHRKQNSVQVFDHELTSICSAPHDGAVYDLAVLPQNGGSFNVFCAGRAGITSYAIAPQKASIKTQYTAGGQRDTQCTAVAACSQKSELCGGTDAGGFFYFSPERPNDVRCIAGADLGRINAMAYWDQKTFITGHSVRLYDPAQSERPVITFATQLYVGDVFQSMAVSDRQPMLAVGSTNGTLTMFDLRKPSEPYAFEMLHEGTSAPIRDLAFTDHDNELFACVGGSVVRLQWQAKLSLQSDPDIKCVASDCMAFTRVGYSGQHVAVASETGRIAVQAV